MWIKTVWLSTMVIILILAYLQDRHMLKYYSEQKRLNLVANRINRSEYYLLLWQGKWTKIYNYSTNILSSYLTRYIHLLWPFRFSSKTITLWNNVIFYLDEAIQWITKYMKLFRTRRRLGLSPWNVESPRKKLLVVASYLFIYLFIRSRPKYKLRYPENTTVTKQILPKAPKKDRWGTYDEETNITYNNIDARTKKNSNKRTALERSVENTNFKRLTRHRRRYKFPRTRLLGVGKHWTGELHDI